jgi:two-component sensor histidine kinase
MRPPTALLTPPRRWRLSTKIVAALAIAMFPMGVLAVVLAVRSRADIGDLPPTLPQYLSMLLPILMWLAALMTAWFAVHRLVVRPLVSIQQLMKDYGHSSDPARTRLRLGDSDHGSTELASLAGSFDAMADEIDRHSRDLRGALDEQQRLTREVHHRVKNNLQIVSSLLSLQARAADTPEIAQTYAVIQARISALTQVHRWMYDDATSDGVDLQALVNDLCASLQASLISPDHRRVSMSCNTEAIIIHPDVAVPVAFLITELASLAALYGANGPLDIMVTASRIDTSTMIAVTSIGFVGADQIAASSMVPTARIIHGMARQLRSSLQHDPVAGRYSVTFAASPP